MIRAKGGNADVMQGMNRSLVLRVLAWQDIYTRVQIAEQVGLQQASISKIIAEFTEMGLIEEIGSVEGRKGRRSIGIRLRADKMKTLAVKLSRDSYQFGVFDVKGTLYEKATYQTDRQSNVGAIVADIKRTINTLLVEYADILAIGIVVPGPYLRNEGRIALMADYPGWDTVDFYQEFQQAYELPVCIEHDANAGALAEWQYGSQAYDGVLLHLLAGSGIGAGIIEKGQILTGWRGIAGELGHMSIDHNGPLCSCGNRGCLRLYCSSIAFVRDAEVRLSEHPESCLNALSKITSEAIFVGGEKGDTYCLELIRRLGYYLGVGVVNTVYLYNANHIVISDDLVRGGTLLMNVIQETVRERLLPVLYDDLTITYSRFGKDTILYGAAAITGNLILDNYTLVKQRGGSGNE